MKFKILLTCVVCFISAKIYADPLGTAFTYQGQLAVNGVVTNGTYDFLFKLYTNSAAGTPLQTIPVAGVAVTNGIFTATLDFGAVFNGTAYWLGISVRSNNVGGYTPLTPYQPLTPTPNALFANTASNLLGTLPAAQLSPGTANINITGSAATAVNGVVTTGSYADAAWITSLAGSKITGNIGGNAATATTANNFSGSLSGDVTGTQTATFVSSVGGQTAANVAAGASAANAATSANTANTIVERDSSGNFAAQTITLSGDLAANRLNVGGGNTLSGSYTTIAGGNGNTASSQNAAVGGGSGNNANNTFATVGGGANNTAGGQWATVSGGDANTAGGQWATVSGGDYNTASSQRRRWLAAETTPPVARGLQWPVAGTTSRTTNARR